MLIAALSDHPGQLVLRILVEIFFSSLLVFEVFYFLPKAFRTGIIEFTLGPILGGPKRYAYRDKNPAKFWSIFILYCLFTLFLCYTMIVIFRGSENQPYP
jgi:hypothetical protein